jgi:hypothetical protein
MAATKKKAPAKKTASKTTKKAAPKKTAPKKTAPKKAAVETGDLDRKSLAARARQLKTELLAIRFNIQSPNLNEYRKKRRELQSVLSRLG